MHPEGGAACNILVAEGGGLTPRSQVLGGGSDPLEPGLRFWGGVQPPRARNEVQRGSFLTRGYHLQNQVVGNVPVVVEKFAKFHQFFTPTS